VNDQEELEYYYFVVDVEGEDASSGPLIITKELKDFELFEVPDINFNFDSAVMLPKALRSLVCCYLYAQDNPSKLVLIAGHADRTGDFQYNQWLSKKRAENVLNVLLGQRKNWVNSVTTSEGPIQRKPEGKSKVEDYQTILSWVATKFGWPCDPGTIYRTNAKNWQRYARMPNNKKAIKAFQESYNKEFHKSIKEDGGMGPETWGAFFDLYLLELAEILGLDSDVSRLETYRSALKFVDGHKILSCGEGHPITRFYTSEDDRRVEILFFDSQDKPKLDYHPNCHEGPLGDPQKVAKCELYGKNSIYRRTVMACDPDHILFIEVRDYEDNPLSGVKVIIECEPGGPAFATTPYGTGETNANGVFVVRDVPEGAYVVSVDTKDDESLAGFTGIKERVKMPK